MDVRLLKSLHKRYNWAWMPMEMAFRIVDMKKRESYVIKKSEDILDVLTESDFIGIYTTLEHRKKRRKRRKDVAFRESLQMVEHRTRRFILD